MSPAPEGASDPHEDDKSSSGEPPGSSVESAEEVLDAEIVEQVERAVERTFDLYIEQFSGPLPPPRMLSEYEEAIPGCGQVILDEWRAETAHRQAIEKQIVTHELANASRGQVFGFAIAVAAMVAGAALILLDKDIYGLIALLAPAGLLAGRFLLSRHSSSDDEAEDDD